ncbi:MAG: hypothetical protein V4579_03485 [Pseudomonadota bacterium]
MSYRIEQTEPRLQAELPAQPYDKWRTLEGEVSVLFYRQPGGFRLRFPGRADFSIELAARTVRCRPCPDMVAEDLADLYFNQVLPLLLGHGGDAVLHASGIAVGGKAVGFIGPTGRGKSTLAAAFARAGHPFLTDDGLILDPAPPGFQVRPRRPILRLCADSEAALVDRAGSPSEVVLWKERVHAGIDLPFQDEPVPLCALYVLREPSGCDAPVIAALPPAAATTALMSHTFILDVEDRAAVAALFHRLGEVVDRVACFVLDYPRRYADLPGVVDAIIGHVHKEVQCS